MKEVNLGRFAGPFNDFPYKYFVQSPIGLVPEDGDKATRLIFYLSHNFKNGNQSINHWTPDHLCSVKIWTMLCKIQFFGCKKSLANLMRKGKGKTGRKFSIPRQTLGAPSGFCHWHQGVALPNNDGPGPDLRQKILFCRSMPSVWFEHQLCTFSMSVRRDQAHY